jgi:hypothetical protein
MNDATRREWVDNDEGLYDLQRRSKLPMKKWISENRKLIDAVANNVKTGAKKAHYLKYD